METELLLNEASLKLLCQRYLASALCLGHPSYALVTSQAGPRSHEKNHSIKILRVRENIFYGQPRRYSDPIRDPYQDNPARHLKYLPIPTKLSKQLLPI